MELRKLNLHFQVLYLGTLVKNAENKIVQTSSDNNITSISITKKQTNFYYFSYDDQINNKLIIYELLLLNKVISDQKKINEIKYLEEIGNKDIHLYAKGNLNNKIYFIFLSNDYKSIYAGIYDLEINKYFPIILDSTDENKKKIKDIMKQIPQKDYITILEQNRLFIFGGLIEEMHTINEQSIRDEEKSKTEYSLDHNIINKSCIYFDIEKLEFERQKFPEFSLIPRYRCGASQNGFIYILGGYSSLYNREANICNLVQFGKYFDEKMYKFSVAKIEGENPKDMIDNDLFVIQNRYLISFSGYKYIKIWIMDTNTNKGINVNLKEKLNFDEYNKRDLSFSLLNCVIDDEENNSEDNNNFEKNITLLIAKIIYNDKNNEVSFKFVNISFKFND